MVQELGVVAHCEKRPMSESGNLRMVRRVMSCLVGIELQRTKISMKRKTEFRPLWVCLIVRY